jgi:hypothetical protein
MSSLSKLPAQTTGKDAESTRIDTLETRMSDLSLELKDMRGFLEQAIERLSTGPKPTAATSSTSRSHQLLRELKGDGAGPSRTSLLSNLAANVDIHTGDTIGADDEAPRPGDPVDLAQLALYLKEKQSPLSRRFAGDSIALVLAKHGSFVAMAKQLANKFEKVNPRNARELLFVSAAVDDAIAIDVDKGSDLMERLVRRVEMLLLVGNHSNQPEAWQMVAHLDLSPPADSIMPREVRQTLLNVYNAEAKLLNAAGRVGGKQKASGAGSTTAKGAGGRVDKKKQRPAAASGAAATSQ